MLPRDLPPQVPKPDQTQASKQDQPQASKRHRGAAVLAFSKPNEQGQVEVIVRNRAAFGLPETLSGTFVGTTELPEEASAQLRAQVKLGSDTSRDLYELQGMRARIASMKAKLESMQTNNSGS